MKPTPTMVKVAKVQVNSLFRQFAELRKQNEMEQVRKWERVKQTEWK